MNFEGILSPVHIKMLREESGISDEVIAARGYRTITEPRELHAVGFTRGQCKVPGLLLPVHTTDGGNSLYTYRPDNPRVYFSRGKKRIIKYEFPKGDGIRLDCPPRCLEMLKAPSVPLYVTEGIKKGDALASRGLCAITLFGVSGFKGKNRYNGITWLADWDYVATNERQIYIVFDSDVMTKKEVRQMLDRLIEHLRRKKAKVTPIYLPANGDEKVGVDDYLLTHSVEELEALADAPKPQTQPAPPIVELLDRSPLVLRKPISLIDGKAYAAIWPYVQKIEREGTDRDGNIVRYPEPKVTTEQRLFIIRDDCRTFGDDGDSPLSDLGCTVSLPEVPTLDRLWSTMGFKGFRNGNRPDAVNVFKRIAQVIDRFIDFDHSLTDQKTMCELVACYIIATWFLPAFNVIGFLWPNGERGTGKTQLLTLIAELSYLGQMILAGSSYASLRDMADYSATLCFDDAENMADPKKTDPDKRAFLLAGNRRGNTIAVKESVGNGKWQTRHVETFCARCFSATRYPDPILASRTITIPLVRTPDRYRANADPLDYKMWPADRRSLIDDLWGLALIHLPKLSLYEADANARASLTGRNLEPFKAILAVAAWLEDDGATGLWKRIDDLSVAYQGERQEMESTDLTTLVVRAICKCLVPSCDVLTFCDVCDVFLDSQKVFIKTKEITEVAKAIAEELELGIQEETISDRRIVWILKKL